MPIQSKRNKKCSFIDLEKNIQTNEPPNFGLVSIPAYEETNFGWYTLSQLVKSKRNHKPFWEFVERLKNLRHSFNNIVEMKFKSLHRNVRRKDEIIKIFRATRKKIAHTEECLN